MCYQRKECADDDFFQRQETCSLPRFLQVVGAGAQHATELVFLPIDACITIKARKKINCLLKSCLSPE